ncbi:hypothetical protein CEUSTIGMA_g7285.t1 [Chlamydomonas eustigma]|uniref:BZIP domain-containing protein n=1 Tax=Chlamydomonas eustigma TaxID=1157962 RepID=A0A250X9R9_9CHLO|nr:hypothetical protein CEUSTIGMA_g7285.t1 [Chlamydomonas eustigma]|eukprot:GAX79845.1 hypothetical protein CEUSTIGMA_g7285.t1 [Chlamydomonas eustigma]
MFGAPSQNQNGATGHGRINANDFMMGDVDLDHFLDNYLTTQFGQGDANAAQAQARRVEPVGALPIGLGSGMQPGMNLGFGSMGMGMGMGTMQGVNMNLSSMPGTASNPLASLALLQQQQQQQQQLMLQQLAGAQHAFTPGAGASKSAITAKNARKGRGSAAGKHSKKSEPELSSSDQSDSEDDGSGSEGEPKNRKKLQLSGGADDAERRHQALQEKNRRAQRRFRERQKNKLHDLHKQIDELTAKVGTLQSENSALHSRTNILEKVLDMRNEQIQVMQETKEASGYLGAEEDTAALQGVGGNLVQLTPETIKDLGSEQIYKIYQMYVKELSVLLTESSNGADPTSESSQQLEVLVKDLSMMIMRLGVIKPLETRKFIVVSRQYLGNTETEVIELWKNVMKSIELAEHQQREVVELKRMFLQKIEPIMEERKLLNVQIQSNLPHDTFATKNALTYIKAHEAVIKLRDNLRAEQHVVLEFAVAVFRGVFKPWQMATLLVKCYPAVPDALGIASALAVELGEPDMPMSRQLTLHLGGYLEGNGGAAGAGALMALGTSVGPSSGAPTGAMSGLASFNAATSGFPHLPGGATAMGGMSGLAVGAAAMGGMSGQPGGSAVMGGMNRMGGLMGSATGLGSLGGMSSLGTLAGVAGSMQSGGSGVGLPGASLLGAGSGGLRP